MIHAFLVTLGVLAAIYAFPTIAVLAFAILAGIWAIISSYWFWFTIGLIVSLACPIAIPVVIMILLPWGVSYYNRVKREREQTRAWLRQYVKPVERIS